MIVIWEVKVVYWEETNLCKGVTLIAMYNVYYIFEI